MKLSDHVHTDGRLVSGALGRVKYHQREGRVVVRWDGAAWIVVRPRLRRQGPTSGADDAWVRFCALAGLSGLDQLVFPGRDHVSSPQEDIVFDCEDDGPNEGYVGMQVVVGDPGEVVISILGASEVELAEFAVAWHGHFPVAARRYGSRVVVSLDLNDGEVAQAIVSVIKSIRATHRKRYRRCVACKESTTPEWWHGDGHC